MLNEQERLRYDRQIKLPEIGLEGQQKLKQARILVIGAGGLGCPALQYLAAAGIGNITIVDGDLISVSNLQRQILFSADDIGSNKAICAAKKLSQQNPFVQWNVIPEFVHTALLEELLQHTDLVLDCTDNFATRYLINDTCVRQGVPFIGAALYQYEGQLAVYNMPLADGSFSTSYRDVFPEEQGKKTALNCNAAGVFAILPGIMGLYQANEALKYFLFPEDCLYNKLLTFDVRSCRADVFEFSTPVIKQSLPDPIEGLPVRVLNSQQLKALGNSMKVLLVDVREVGEQPVLEGEHIIQLPLSTLADQELDTQLADAFVFICRSGIRSIKAYNHFFKKNPEVAFYTFQGGVEDLLADEPSYSISHGEQTV